MHRNRLRTTTILTIAIASGLAGAGFLSPAALSQEATLQPAAVDTAQTPTVDAKSALLNAIALGFTEIRSAGLVGDFYQIETVDADGRTLRLYMDPESGVVIKIGKD